jgi:hypothetical protein
LHIADKAAMQTKKAGVVNMRKKLLIVLAICIVGWIVSSSFDQLQFQFQNIKTKYQIAKLKKRIEKDVPALKGSISDFEKVNLLRDWAYSNIDFSSEKALLCGDKQFRFYEKDVCSIFSAFDADKGGEWCGGAAFALMKLYDAYGFKAHASGSGDPNVMTHAFTIVRINYKGSPLFIIEDATFNITYVDPDGAPYDYRELYSVLQQRRRDMIRIVHGKNNVKDLLMHPDDKKADLDHYILKGSEPASIKANGFLKYKAEVSLTGFYKIFGQRIKKYLVGKGYPADPIYLFLIGPDLPPADWAF